MGSPYVGEIRMFAGNFAPNGWMFCQGQLLPIAGNEVLFNLIGTTYGGDGQETFALPDLQGRLPIHMGNGFNLGELAGNESATLITSQLPSHTHPLAVSGNAAAGSTPVGNVPGAGTTISLYKAAAATLALAPQALLPAGGNQPHDNLQPYLCIDFIISLFGIFPSQ